MRTKGKNSKMITKEERIVENTRPRLRDSIPDVDGAGGGFDPTAVTSDVEILRRSFEPGLNLSVDEEGADRKSASTTTTSPVIDASYRQVRLHRGDRNFSYKSFSQFLSSHSCPSAGGGGGGGGRGSGSTDDGGENENRISGYWTLGRVDSIQVQEL